ncbi:MAG: nucleoside triphosphate pyrophosphohydrolase [Lentisphaerae bacterium]|nr:nucleoside triphosphate pyrophosphohydrolase [Lentisphaerota bacterium]
MENYSADADSLLRVLRRLRAPDGCPWDRKQTRTSLVRHLESECGELIDAIDRNDPPHIKEELGDVLMNLLFQVVIAEENGEFTLEEVWREIIDKMIRRHAHVFGDAHAENADDVVKLWEKIKAGERRERGEEKRSAMDSVKHSLSALTRAEKLQEKAAEVNFDWSDTAGIVAKIKEETSEVEAALSDNDDDAVDEELGDLLFAVINLIRYRKRSRSEDLLRRANGKFEQRFRIMEKEAENAGLQLADLSVKQLDALWEKAKTAEK